MPTPILIRYGKDTRLQVGDGAAIEVFTNIAGEGTLSLSRQAESMDTSSKDDGNYSTEQGGKIKITMSIAGVTKTPDAGLTLLETAAKTCTPVNIKLTRNVGAPVTLFAASVSPMQTKFDFNEKGPVNYSYDLSLAAAPTTDNLVA